MTSTRAETLSNDLADSLHLSDYDRLDRAYQRQSLDSLRAVFDDLVNHTHPMPMDSLRVKLEPERHAYEIFRIYYRPKDLSAIGREKPRPRSLQAGPNYYRDIAYAFVQNEIRFDIYQSIPARPFYVGESPPPGSSLKILNYRPDVSVPG